MEVSETKLDLGWPEAMDKFVEVNLRFSHEQFETISKLKDLIGTSVTQVLYDAIELLMEDWEAIEESRREREAGTQVTFTMEEAREILGL